KVVFEKWQLAHAVIGVVTNTKRVQATRHGKLEIDIPVDPITEKAPRYERPMQRSVPTVEPNACEQLEADSRKHGFAAVLAAMVEDTGKKERIYRQYDQHIGRKTVYDSSAQGAAVLWIRSELTESQPYLGLGIATSCNERYCAVDARIGGALSVTKAARMLYAVGAQPLALTDCLNFGNPEVPEVMAQFSDAVDGISE